MQKLKRLSGLLLLFSIFIEKYRIFYTKKCTKSRILQDFHGLWQPSSNENGQKLCKTKWKFGCRIAKFSQTYSSSFWAKISEIKRKIFNRDRKRKPSRWQFHSAIEEKKLMKDSTWKRCIKAAIGFHNKRDTTTKDVPRTAQWLLILNIP